MEPKKIRRRERAKIYYDILCSIIEQEDRESGDGVKITRVQIKVNLPSDSFRFHLREMNSLGLIEWRATLASTEKGRAFVSEYKKVVSVLERFGLL